MQGSDPIRKSIQDAPGGLRAFRDIPECPREPEKRPRVPLGHSGISPNALCGWIDVPEQHPRIIVLMVMGVGPLVVLVVVVVVVWWFW